MKQQAWGVHNTWDKKPYVYPWTIHRTRAGCKALAEEWTEEKWDDMKKSGHVIAKIEISIIVSRPAAIGESCDGNESEK